MSFPYIVSNNENPLIAVYLHVTDGELDARVTTLEENDGGNDLNGKKHLHCGFPIKL